MPAHDASSPLPALPVTAVNLPLLGSRREPAATFQYVLQAVAAAGVEFSCPAWVVRREHFRAGDRIDFHFPFGSADGWHRQHAEIVHAAPLPDGGGQLCRAEFRDAQPLHHPVYASLETADIRFQDAAGEAVDPDGLLTTVLRDCLLQKRGVAVYFKHLVPLFSRITLFPSADYPALRTLLLEDVRKRIEANIATFDAWHAAAAAGRLTAATLPRDLDLESLRAAVEPEIEADLFNATFASPTIQPYLAAIRLLEHKLYLNHNTLVLLYARGV